MHAPRHAEIKADPNLVPLLDLVFQLIMFFMICVNFVSEQTNVDVKLPSSQSARPMEKGEIDVLFLNLKADGTLVIPGQERPLSDPVSIRFVLRQQFSDARRAAEQRGDRSGQVRTTIILRADRDVTYGQIFHVLRTCREIGYRKLQLRALSKREG